MWRRTALAILLGLISAGARAASVEAKTKNETWTPTTWHGERAFAADSSGWRAIVSIDRARLIYFGGDDEKHNLLFAPITRDDPAGWGGHRLWLGPQTTWLGGDWPPPAAWEKSAAERVGMVGASIELTLADAGGGWPRLVREYFWKDGRLHCVARMSGGTRNAQFIQILQVPSSAEVQLKTAVSADLPRGYAQVHLGRKPSPNKIFPPPPHATEVPGGVRLKFTNRTEKFGFPAQPILAQIDSTDLRIARGAGEGVIVSTPDDGLMTQVYLGSGASQLNELEQLSPLHPAGAPASFEIVIAPSPR